MDVAIKKKSGIMLSLSVEGDHPIEKTVALYRKKPTMEFQMKVFNISMLQKAVIIYVTNIQLQLRMLELIKDQ